MKANKPGRAGKTRIEISGWTYKPWRKVFYPDDLAQRRELEFASRQFNSIEINGSFYSLQRPSSYERWHDETPADFVFSVKGSRFITHMKRLRDIEVPLANFFASGVLCLRQKLGPILWQFPPQMRWDEQKFRNFFSLLPRDTTAASRLASRHDQRLNGRAVLKAGTRLQLRYAIEIRHDSFLVPQFFSLLREHNMAFVFSDAAAKWPYAEDLTADFVYARLHGAKKLYSSGYGNAELEKWAKRIRLWRTGKNPRDAILITSSKEATKGPHDIFFYFDNDAKVHAPFDARRLHDKLERGS